MSYTIIKNGENGDTMKVNPSGRALTLSTTRSHIAHESIDEQVAFIFASDFISLTNTASMNALMYVKNTDSTGKFFVIEKIRVCSDGGSMGDSVKVKYEFNPTAGTIISDAVEGIKTNLFLGSSVEAGIIVYTGGDNKTATGGTAMTQYINHSPGHSIQDYNGALILSKNQGFCIFAQPSVATDICIEIIGYYETLND